MVPLPETAVTRVFRADGDGILSDVRRFVAQAGRGIGPALVRDLQLAVTEACSNAIRHSGTDEIRVTVAPRDSCLEVVVEDDGVYREELQIDGAEPEGHRGMFLMVAMVDELTLKRGTERGKGTTVRLLKCLA
jgi:serine/threonine-protein kinase RsbW